jgi:hypothetical protein
MSPVSGTLIIHVSRQRVDGDDSLLVINDSMLSLFFCQEVLGIFVFSANLHTPYVTESDSKAIQNFKYE